MSNRLFGLPSTLGVLCLVGASLFGTPNAAHASMIDFSSPPIGFAGSSYSPHPCLPSSCSVPAEYGPGSLTYPGSITLEYGYLLGADPTTTDYNGLAYSSNIYALLNPAKSLYGKAHFYFYYDGVSSFGFTLIDMGLKDSSGQTATPPSSWLVSLEEVGPSLPPLWTSPVSFSLSSGGAYQFGASPSLPGYTSIVQAGIYPDPNDPVYGTNWDWGVAITEFQFSKGVPEPTSMALFGIALLGLGMVRRARLA